MNSFEDELQQLINQYSIENLSNTPDFILARYLWQCLTAWNAATFAREQWYGHSHEPGQPACEHLESFADLPTKETP